MNIHISWTLEQKCQREVFSTPCYTFCIQMIFQIYITKYKCCRFHYTELVTVNEDISWVVSKVLDLTKKTKNVVKTILFLNIVFIYFDTVLSTLSNSFDTLFIVKTNKFFKIVNNRTLHLFIVSKIFTTEPFFRV